MYLKVSKMTGYREIYLLEQFDLSFYNGRVFLISFLDSHISNKVKFPNPWDQFFSPNTVYYM